MKIESMNLQSLRKEQGEGLGRVGWKGKNTPNQNTWVGSSGPNPYSGGILKRNTMERVMGPYQENPEQQGCCCSGEPTIAAHSKGRSSQN
jgi:hypothetical protein